jgi:hypothetical protein
MKPEVSPRNGTRRYAVFLSYRHADNKEPGRQWATWLHQMLENYEIPASLVGTKNSRGNLVPASMYPVFRDEEELPADAELSAPINLALRNSEHLVVICSPSAVESRYVSDEILTFKKLGKADHILALIIRGEPGVSDGSAKYATDSTTTDECFPEVLRRQLDQNGKVTNQVTQPVAADFRVSGAEEGWTTPQAYRDHLERIGGIPKKELRTRVAKYAERCALMKLKLIAGVLGIPLGELTRRDEVSQLKRARKRQRLIIWVAASLAFLLCLAVGGGLIAITKQREARNALKEQKRLSFEAIVRNAEADDADGESEKVVAALEPYLTELELAEHPMRPRAIRLTEKARDGYKRLAEFAVRLRRGDRTLTLDLGNGVMLELVLIPAGTFTMGSAPSEHNSSITLASPEDESDRSDKEAQHKVVITRPFYMGKFHVTQEQYESVTQKNPQLL